MPSLKNIADAIGVSPSLVSKVLNNNLGTTGVSTALRDRICTTAHDMGYRKNYSAAALWSRRQNTVAVLFHRFGSIGSSLVERFLRGIAESANTHGLRINLDFFKTQEIFHKKRELIHSGWTDGLIVGGVFHKDIIGDLLEIQKTGMPVVTVHNDPLHRDIVNIGAESAELASIATTHLIAQGCRRIVHFDAIPARTRGHLAALHQAGLPSCKDLLPVPHSIEEAFQLPTVRHDIRAFLDRKIPFDGFSAPSDLHAVAMLHELLARGIRVPEDIKIVGIDNSPLAEAASIPISSVDQRLVDRGHLAVEAIQSCVAGNTVASTFLTPHLVQRESSAN